MLSRYDPFREPLSLRKAMDELFAQSFVSPVWGRSPQEMLTPMDVQETEQGYHVRIAVPGVKPDDIEVTLQQNTLTIRGQYGSPEAGQEQNIPEKRQGNWLVRELRYGTFERTVTFDRPIDQDRVQTEYENGLLTLFLPVSEASRPRRISVKGSQNQPQQMSIGGGSKTPPS
jgi:HSP20 family protein